ncbi:hypothetical protein NMY22_g17464 [Coprinellus aureogranulatus]|nr:hypothetical protein NMY22_g17464 [Coprinellus aureogranulatus]
MEAPSEASASLDTETSLSKHARKFHVPEENNRRSSEVRFPFFFLSPLRPPDADMASSHSEESIFGIRYPPSTTDSKAFSEDRVQAPIDHPQVGGSDTAH